MLGQWETQGMILGDNSMVRGVCSGVEMEPSERNRHLQRRRRVGGEGEELRWLRSEQRKRGRCRYGVPPPLQLWYGAGRRLLGCTAPVIMHVAARFVRLRVPPMHRRRALSRNPCD